MSESIKLQTCGGQVDLKPLYNPVNDASSLSLVCVYGCVRSSSHVPNVRVCVCVTMSHLQRSSGIAEKERRG